MSCQVQERAGRPHVNSAARAARPPSERARPWQGSGSHELRRQPEAAYHNLRPQSTPARPRRGPTQSRSWTRTELARPTTRRTLSTREATVDPLRRAGKTLERRSAPTGHTYVRWPGRHARQTSKHGPGKAVQSFKRSQQLEAAYHNPSLRSAPAGQGGGPAYQQAQPLQGGSSCLSAAGSRRQQTIAWRRTAPTHSLTRTERVNPTSRRAPSSRELLRTDSDERPRAGARRPTARTLGDQGSAPIDQASKTFGKAAKVTRAPSAARGSVPTLSVFG